MRKEALAALAVVGGLMSWLAVPGRSGAG